MEQKKIILTPEARKLLESLTNSPLQMEIILRQQEYNQIIDPYWKGLIKAVLTLNQITEKK